MSKNILILSPFHSPNIGGAETFLDGLEKEASKWFNITVLTYHPFFQKAKKYEEYYNSRGSLKIHRINWLVNPSSLWSGVSMINAFLVIPKLAVRSLFILIKNRYDVIHCQGLLSGFVGVFLKIIFRTRVLLTLLALYEFKNWAGVKYKLARWTLNNCDKIFVEGENGADDIRTFSIPQEKIIKFQHWVDDRFVPPRKRATDRIRVLFIGRSIPEKGRHIVEGAERLLNDPKFEFIYVENVPYKDLPKYYQMAHIVVVPSLYPEGFSRVVAESASCGCFVITSDRGSLPEMVKSFGVSIDPTAENFVKQIKIAGNEWKKCDYGAIMNFVYPERHFSKKNAEVFLNEYSTI